MSEWTHPICEKDWISRNSTWEHVTTTPDGEPVEALTSIRMPTRIKNEDGTIGPVERCCFCQEITISGIYVRHDPSDIPDHPEHRQTDEA